MPVTVKVNGAANSLVHKGSSGISTATVPDVCQTPSPVGPVPIPYPNISQSATLDGGSTTVTADGGNMIATQGSEFAMSNGDNAGVAGGVASGTFMKESTFLNFSPDVKIDGQSACRLTDPKLHNHENTANTAGTMQAPVVVLGGELGAGTARTITAEEANQPHQQVGHKPPYAEGTEVQELELKEDTVFARVHGPKQNSTWFARAEDIKGLSAAQIKDKLGLKHLPQYVSEVRVPAGTKIRIGIVGAQPEWGCGGGAIQVESMSRLSDSAFKLIGAVP